MSENGLATSGSNLPVVVAARVTEGWSTDRAMDLQQSGVHDDILSILSHYCLQPSICSCLRTVSVALQIHDVKIISHDFTMVIVRLSCLLDLLQMSSWDFL